jgi:PEP-CTERM motif
MKRSLSLFAAAFALALTATAQSQADPFSYTYNWSASPIAISAGTGGVTLTNGTPITTTLETDTAATNLTVFSAAATGSPDVIQTPAGGSNYTLAVTLTDNQGAGTATVTFTGLLLGQLTHDSSTLTNAITGSTDDTGTHAGQTFGVVTFDGTKYTVSYNGFAAPGPEAQHNVGSISFHIAFDGAVGGPPDAPEPSSMVLGCLGLSFLGGVALRARRRKAELLKAAI